MDKLQFLKEYIRALEPEPENDYKRGQVHICVLIQEKIEQIQKRGVTE